MDTTTTTQQTTEKPKKVIKGITCPACGGELDVREGVKTFNCKYCGTLLTVKGTGNVLRFYVPRKLKKEDAINRTFSWIGSGLSKEKGLREKSKIEDAFLVYIPFWRARADVVGWVFGQEKRTRTVNNRTETYYVDVERKVERSYDRTYPAADMAELGIRKINLAGDEIRPIDFETLQQDGMLFNVVSSEKEASDKAFNFLEEDASQSNGLHKVYFEHYSTIRKKFDIVYYPLWVVRYSYANRTYQVIVDGEDGTICYGKAPGSNAFRAVVGVLGIGAGMYIATLLGIFGVANGSGIIFFYIICVMIGIAIITWAYKKFRYGGEVEEGTGLQEDTTSSSKSVYGVTAGDATKMLGGLAAGGVTSMAFNMLSNYNRRN